VTSGNRTGRSPRIEAGGGSDLEPARWPARPGAPRDNGRPPLPDGARSEEIVPSQAVELIPVGPRLQTATAVRLLNSLALYAIPLLVVLAVFAAGCAGAVRERQSALNGATPPIEAGRSVGQTFTAKYDALAAVELQLGTYGRQNDPTRAELVVSLRRGVTDTVEVASLRVPPDAALEENGWLALAFPAIQDSAGQTYYVEVTAPSGTPANSMGVFAFRPDPHGEAYEGGQAYADGVPVPGDLAFGLVYAAPPLDVWAAMIGRVLGGALGLLVLAAAVAVGWAAWRLPPLLSDPPRARAWLLRWSLPAAMTVAVLNGLLYLAVVPPWQGPDEASHYAYAALVDRYDMDVGRVRGADLWGPDRPTGLIEAINRSIEQSGALRYSTGVSRPVDVNAGTDVFQQTRQPAPYYWLAALGVRAARALGIPADPAANPEAALGAMRAVSMLLSLVVVWLAWLAGAIVGGRTGAPWLRLALPVTVALLPMHAFMASVANNDIMAELVVSALFVTLAALLLGPGGRRAAGLAALAILLASLSVFAKGTAVAAALPLLVGGLAVWAGMALRRKGPFGRLQKTDRRRAALVAAGTMLLAQLLVVGLVAAAYTKDEGSALGWLTTPHRWDLDRLARAARVQAADAHHGTHAVELTGEMSATHDLVPNFVHPSMLITFTGWVRAVDGAELVEARLAVLEGVREDSAAGVTLAPGGEWARLQTTSRVGRNAEPVGLRIAAGADAGRVQFDDMAVEISPDDPAWGAGVFTPRLLDPSAESAPSVLQPWAAALVPGDVEAMADALANPQVFDRWALWGEYAQGQWRTFWGSFGWLTLPLPEPVYAALGVLTLLAIAGLGAWAARRDWSDGAWLALVAAVALAAAIAVGFARQMTLLAFGTIVSGPQGRYLFVLAIPVVWLLLVGLSEAWGRTTGVRRAEASRWDVWLWANALLFIAAFALLGLMLPFYHG
jgi:hypothetical protein